MITYTQLHMTVETEFPEKAGQDIKAKSTGNTLGVLVLGGLLCVRSMLKIRIQNNPALPRALQRYLRTGQQ